MLKFSNCVLLRVSTNNNNYEQPIALFVIILAKNSFMNQHGVIYCWCQVGRTVTTSILAKSTRQHDGCNIYYNKCRDLYNKRLSACRRQIADKSTMVWLGRCHLAFAVANCVFNLRFAAALLDAAVTAGSCDGLLARPAI